MGSTAECWRKSCTPPQLFVRERYKFSIEQQRREGTKIEFVQLHWRDSVRKRSVLFGFRYHRESNRRREDEEGRNRWNGPGAFRGIGTFRTFWCAVFMSSRPVLCHCCAANLPLHRIVCNWFFRLPDEGKRFTEEFYTVQTMFGGAAPGFTQKLHALPAEMTRSFDLALL